MCKLHLKLCAKWAGKGRLRKSINSWKDSGLCWWHRKGGGRALLPSRRCVSHRIWATSCGLPSQAEDSLQAFHKLAGRGLCSTGTLQPKNSSQLFVCYWWPTSERLYFPEGKNVWARQATGREKCVQSWKVMEPRSDPDVCRCWGCLERAPPAVSSQHATAHRPVLTCPSHMPRLGVPRKRCEKIHREIGKVNTPQTEAGLLKNSLPCQPKSHLASSALQRHLPTGIFCLVSWWSMQVAMWWEGLGAGIFPPIFPPWLEKPPANPPVLSQYACVSLPYSHHHHYPKTLFVFVFLRMQF